MTCHSNHPSADGWFEWQVIEGQKYPHHIFSEMDEVFAFAGIGKTIHQQGSTRNVFSILTRSAPSNLLHIHHRAPVALTETQWEQWPLLPLCFGQGNRGTVMNMQKIGRGTAG